MSKCEGSENAYEYPYTLHLEPSMAGRTPGTVMMNLRPDDDDDDHESVLSMWLHACTLGLGPYNSTNCMP
jgi:hypothetical protein